MGGLFHKPEREGIGDSNREGRSVKDRLTVWEDCFTVNIHCYSIGAETHVHWQSTQDKLENNTHDVLIQLAGHSHREARKNSPSVFRFVKAASSRMQSDTNQLFHSKSISYMRNSTFAHSPTLRLSWKLAR